ncbi:hypothetical protein BDQ12DRAFT_664050 [Crucibulum laeve]|uniref:Cora-domain-containing protein n=1 Tax=Crucibulum laeve TaxID=68775 RepID=A0A5C3MJ17_9AGAR|nr:hypothetical protein BDQ12DRAFT_664050 [Crucibulum laeve]
MSLSDNILSSATSSTLVSSPPVRPALPPLQPPDLVIRHERDETDDDIYRGEPPSPSRSPSPASTASSSSSSSGSFLGGGRLGAIAAVVELAITRWAKGNDAASLSDSSSSSSSSHSSIVTITRSQMARRRKRKSSVSSLHTVVSERSIAARINRMKALEESRQIRREFALYLPPSLASERRLPGSNNLSSGAEDSMPNTRRITTTTSLSSVLDQLDAALKKPLRARRPHGKHRAHRVPPNGSASSSHLQYMVPHQASGSSGQSSIPDISASRRAKKGKHKETFSSTVTSSTNASASERPNLMPKAWFLDVASPTWEDLRAIGKLLHLHPLTLEDILQQDPREKLELFPKLGYYFISFRAIESQATREKIQRGIRRPGEGPDGCHNQDEGPVGEANVYLTVFNEGICCSIHTQFHFTDISAIEHTDRVRHRIVLLEEVINMSSDWIAHGILDSIVDSFFPFLDEIEKEVMAIDELVFSGPVEQGSPQEINTETGRESSPESMTTVRVDSSEKPSISQESGYVKSEDKLERENIPEDIRPRFARPRLTVTLIIRRLKRYVVTTWLSLSMISDSSPSASTTTLRRMARTRRLVTSLGRLLATKSDVVTQVKKRLHDFDRIGLGNGTSKAEDLEIAMYMGDIQDHILTIQHSLAHYERMLSQSHPTYLAQLRASFATTKSGKDMALIYLTVVTVAVLCVQTLIGLFSVNITIPSNERDPSGPYNVFGIIIALATVILCGYLSVVRYWWNQSKRRRGAVL